MLTVTAVQPSGTPSQTTQYVYGVTTGQGSDINSNDLLAATLYPDPTTGEPSTSQEETYTYNALGQVTTYTDRDGNTHEYLYDVLGRQVSDIVTTLGAGVDGSVRRIDTAYNQQGIAYLFTSYADTAGTEVVNQVEDFFNGLGQLTREYQSQDGAVNLCSTPPVIYCFTQMSGGQNNSRLISITYPSAYQVDYNYNAGLDSSISRLSSISDNSGILEAYVYLGVGTVVEWEHPQTGVDETYISPTGSIGPAGDDIIGLDQFGRVVDDAYINAVTGQYTDEFLYTYDQDSDVVSMTNALYTAYSQTYSYNNLNELTGYTQGDGSSQSINYDALGNITSTTTGGVQVARTSNAQNEYTSVAGSTASPTYDNNGNLTTDPTTGNQFTYNAWNQLVSVSNGGTVLATFELDALGRMVAETTSGTTTDMYYNTEGQIIEERVSSEVTTQYVWCSLGTNQLVCMNYDPVDGVPTQRVYVQQDAIGNVMSLVSTSGNVVDRYSYTPFGQQTQYEITSPAPDMPYGFQCMFTYGSLGIAQDGERIYDFSLQVFAQMDPIGMADGSANGYEVVNNNPVNYIDPSGLDGFGAWLSNTGQNMAANISGAWNNITNGTATQILSNGAANTVANVSSGAYWNQVGQNMSANLSNAWTNANSGPQLTENPVGEPGTWTGIIPLYGSGRNLINDIQTGQYGWAVVHGGLLATDIFLVKAVVVGGGRAILLGIGKGGVSKITVSGGKIGLEALTEAEAASILQEIECANRAAGVPSHFLGRHGAQTTLLQQARRARRGIFPEGGMGRPAPASRFLSNKDQLTALLRSQEEIRLGGPSGGRLYFEYIIGEGYLRGGGQGAYTLTGGAEYFYRNGRLVTLYPLILP